MSASTPEPGGFFWDEAMNLLKKIYWKKQKPFLLLEGILSCSIK